MRITVIGCGRWGSFLAWYLNTLHHEVTLYGRKGSRTVSALMETRCNEYLRLPDEVRISTDLACADSADILVISVNSQGLRALISELAARGLHDKTVVLCMKGLEIGTGERLSVIAASGLDASCKIAVWLGPGHVQEFYAGNPNCMVIDSDSEEAKQLCISAFSGPLIRFYYGEDLLGNEIGAASKNVIGIASGMLDAEHLSTLKGALMSRGTREIARLISAMGGNELSAYGLCHLGDYEATVFSPYSHNRTFGENFIRGVPYTALAEGYYTVSALMELSRKYGVELPICQAVHRILYEKAEPRAALATLFDRSLKTEFYS